MQRGRGRSQTLLTVWIQLHLFDESRDCSGRGGGGGGGVGYNNKTTKLWNVSFPSLLRVCLLACLFVCRCCWFSPEKQKQKSKWQRHGTERGIWNQLADFGPSPHLSHPALRNFRLFDWFVLNTRLFRKKRRKGEWKETGRIPELYKMETKSHTILLSIDDIGSWFFNYFGIRF